VPEPRARPQLYTIPPSAPFLSTLARAILAGDLPAPGGPAPDRLTLPHTTIYLPTRRAARGLREAFLAACGGEALLLPRIQALGQTDEDAALILDAEAFDEPDGALGKPAIEPLARIIALMRLIFAWNKRADSTKDLAQQIRFNITPGQAASLAADLADLMDLVESEETDFGALQELVPEELAAHWEATVDFLSIVTEYWPRCLDDNGLVSPVARRNLLMANETARLAAASPYPVIAAGSTGTVPATARLLETIANLPNGAVVLPGLDASLDEESWETLADHPEHPQAGMAHLLRKMGALRGDVAFVPGSAPDDAQAARLHLVSETLRPAETTERWQQAFESDPSSPQARENLATALHGLSLVEAPSAHDEAEAVALVLRACIEEPGKTAALITPDRVLARRVAARLKAYGLDIDDSAGTPVQHTVPGAFLNLILSAIENNFAPTELMALLKHPLMRLSRRAADIRRAARALERGLFRDVYLGRGSNLGEESNSLDGLSGIVHGISNPGPHAKISRTERLEAQALVRDLEEAFGPLVAPFASGDAHTTASLTGALADGAEKMARDEDGALPLWDGDAGEALSVFLSRLIAEGDGFPMKARSYPAFYRTLLQGQAVRPRGPAHPRLFIWGQLEARLQQPDTMVLGGLNEGSWPRNQDTGPWLSRPMRAKLGLSPPERRIGLAAHDFAQALGAKSVILTRALKVDGVPTVPSRWLQRLQALVAAVGADDALAPTEPWLPWARERDAIEHFEPAGPPEPRPPVAARPRALSVTQIERWIANPYEIYAKHILKLRPLMPLGSPPDAAMRGSAFHRILHLFATAYPDRLPEDITGALCEIGDEVFRTMGDRPTLQAFWRPGFHLFARWFAETEPSRRANVVRTVSEVSGELALTTRFRLTARADRIDETEDGSLIIYDYKTGPPPKPKHVSDLFAPQLPLEAAIAEAGGFAGLGPCAVRGLIYIRASGRDEGGLQQDASKDAPNVLAAKALEDLKRLVIHFDDPSTAYDVKRRAGAAFTGTYSYDDYAQLARVAEWLTEGEGS